MSPENPLLSGSKKLASARLLGMNIFQRGYYDLFVQLGPDLCHFPPSEICQATLERGLVRVPCHRVTESAGLLGKG